MYADKRILGREAQRDVGGGDWMDQKDSRCRSQDQKGPCSVG